MLLCTSSLRLTSRWKPKKSCQCPEHQSASKAVGSHPIGSRIVVDVQRLYSQIIPLGSCKFPVQLLSAPKDSFVHFRHVYAMQRTHSWKNFGCRCSWSTAWIFTGRKTVYCALALLSLVLVADFGTTPYCVHLLYYIIVYRHVHHFRG